MNEILGSLQPVIASSEHVRIDRAALEKFCRWIVPHKLKAPSWDYHCHFYDGGERTVAYLLVLDSLNFCFWGEPRWEIDFDGGRISGYRALAAALKRAVAEGVPILEARYLSSITREALSQILRGNGCLQLLEKRLEILHEIGSVLQDQYEGRAHRLVEAAQRSSARLVQTLVKDFSSYRDEALYRGHRVLFRKRAQIFVADLYAAFQGRRWGEFCDLGGLTAFADYKLPQVLRHVGILQYSSHLADRVDRQELLEPGSGEEVEIRAHTIWAVELIRQELVSQSRNLRAFEIDWLLWNLGQDPAYKVKPYHRTVTIYY